MAVTHDALLSYLREKLRVDTTKIGPQTPLVTSDLVDSFGLVELVLFIEKNCRIKMKASEVNLDNLDSIERILAFVASRCDESDGSG